MIAIKYQKVAIRLLPAALLVLVTGCTVVTGGAPVEPDPAMVEWEQAFGGTGRDTGHVVRQTADGGFIVVGQSFSFGNGDGGVYLIRTDERGRAQWQRYYTTSARGTGHFVRELIEGGFIVIGQTWPEENGTSYLYLLKVDAGGEMLWEQTFGGEGSMSGQHVVQTFDGGFVVSGWIEPAGAGRRACLVKVDHLGRRQWESSFGRGDWSVGQHVLEITGEGYLVTGWTESEEGANRDVYVAKLDLAGSLEWERTIGSADDEIGLFARQDDNSYIIAGQSFSYTTGSSSVYLTGLDFDGQVLWEEHAVSSDNYLGLSVFPANDGGYLVLGQMMSSDGYRSIVLAKHDLSGRKSWELYSGGYKDDSGLYAIQAEDGGYVVTGWTESFGPGDKSVYLVKFMP